MIGMALSKPAGCFWNTLVTLNLIFQPLAFWYAQLVNCVFCLFVVPVCMCECMCVGERERQKFIIVPLVSSTGHGK